MNSSGKLENKSKESFICLKEKNIQDSVHVALQCEFCSQAGVGTKYEITPGRL